MKKLFLFFVFLIPFTLNSDENIFKFIQKYKWISSDRTKPYHILEFKNDRIVRKTIFEKSTEKQELFIIKKEIKNNTAFILVNLLIKDEDDPSHYEIYQYFWGISKFSTNEILVTILCYPKDDGEPYNEILEIYE